MCAMNRMNRALVVANILKIAYPIKFGSTVANVLLTGYVNWQLHDSAMEANRGLTANMASH